MSPHRILLRPRVDHQLRLISCVVETEPSSTLFWSQDIFGNSVAHATFREPTEKLVIWSEVLIEQSAPAWPVFAIAASAHTYPFAYSADERTDLGAQLVPQFSDPDRRLEAWTQSVLGDAGSDTLSLLRRLNSAVRASARYEARHDTRTYCPTETIANDSATCRDYAVLLAEAARTLGFAARIASGYLLPGVATTAGEGATHAWTEIYLPGAGWIAFDPTNATMGAANLVCVAVARDIAQTTPISGGYVGAPGAFLAMDVSLTITL